MSPSVVHTTSSTNSNSNQANTSINEENNELDESICTVQYVYLEKQVDITRPDNYTSRGFGFLLNSGLATSNNVKSPISVLVRNKDTNETETILVNENYALIVVVEPGKN